jgi:hypothetical protein
LAYPESSAELASNGFVVKNNKLKTQERHLVSNKLWKTRKKYEKLTFTSDYVYFSSAEIDVNEKNNSHQILLVLNTIEPSSVTTVL